MHDAKKGNPIGCAACRADLEGYLDGSLGAVQEAAVRAHLKACPSCRAEEALFTGLRSAATLQAAPPDGFREALDERLRRYESLGLGKEDVYLPGVRFYGTDDVSFLRHARYVLLKNYYRRKIFRVLGEYFPNRAAASLVDAVHRYRDALSRQEERTVSFREALHRWQVDEFAAWKEIWRRPAEDADRRLSTRIRKRMGRVSEWIKMAVLLVPLALFLWWFLPAGRTGVHLVHHFRDENRLEFEATVRKEAARAGYTVRFTPIDEEALLHALHYHGGQTLRDFGADALVMDVNLLSIFLADTRSTGTSGSKGGAPGITPLFHYNPIPPEFSGDGLSSFSVFSAVLAGTDGALPVDEAKALARFRGYRGLYLRRTAPRIPPLYRMAGMVRLSARGKVFFARLVTALRDRFRTALPEGVRVFRAPEVYRRWRLAFPEYRIYGMLTINTGNTERMFREYFRLAQERPRDSRN